MSTFVSFTYLIASGLSCEFLCIRRHPALDVSVDSYRVMFAKLTICIFFVYVCIYIIGSRLDQKGYFIFLSLAEKRSQWCAPSHVLAFHVEASCSGIVHVPPPRLFRESYIRLADAQLAVDSALLALDAPPTVREKTRIVLQELPVFAC